MKTCGTCIYWQKVKSIKDFGVCCVSVPHWVIVENYDNIVHKQSKACEYALEEQEETKEDLMFKIKQLEEKIYVAKVQESLLIPIVDEYGKAS